MFFFWHPQNLFFLILNFKYLPMYETINKDRKSESQGPGNEYQNPTIISRKKYVV